jgi:uncharacterized repeat protein (TIGR01451 family)
MALLRSLRKDHGARGSCGSAPAIQPARCGRSRRSASSIRSRRGACVYAYVLCLMGAGALAAPAMAQIQRVIVNPSFEDRLLPPAPISLMPLPANNFVEVDESWVSGWLTTAPVVTGGCPAPMPNCRPIEMWSTPFIGLTAPDGIITAELNAFNFGMLYQTVCMTSGESLLWSFDHHGRAGTDTAAFRLGIPTGLPAGSKPADTYSFPIAQAATPNNGTLGTVTNLDPTNGTVNAPVLAPNGWTKYSGAYTFPGASGLANIGFVAIAAAGGNIAVGNELDAIVIQLSPYVEFSAANFAINNSATNVAPKVIIAGSVPAGGVAVTVTVTGGTAVLGTDYLLGVSGDPRLTAISSTANSVTFTIPAGAYSTAEGGNVFAIPLAAIASQAQLSTLTFSVAPGGVHYTVASTVICGAPAVGTTALTITETPQLGLTKSASSTSFVVGVPASYTLTVTNTGTVTTTPTAATVTDTIPALLTLGPMPAGCTTLGQTVTCTVPPGLAAGQLVSFVIPVTPQAGASGTTLNNSALVSGGGDPACPAGVECTGRVSTPVNAPQLTLRKSAGAPSFVVGVPATYTLQVTNAGTAATTAAATVTDFIPSVLSPGTMPPGCVATGQTVTCTVPLGLAAGQLVSFVIPVTPLGAAGGTTVTNSATVSGGGDPSCPVAPHCASTVATAVNEPELTLQKSAGAPAFVNGVPATYTLSISNTGTAATTAPATITDNIPADLSLGALPAGCAAVAATVTCTVPAGLATGQLVSFVIHVTPQASASGTTAINTATAAGGGDPSCPAAAHCTATVTTPIEAPQLTVVKSPSTASFVVGVAASYTLMVTNSGTAATTAAAAITDNIPALLTLGAAPAGCTASGQTVTCTVPAGLATGQVVSFVIPVTPLAAAAGTTAANTATASGGGDPSCPAADHCTSTVDTPVEAPQLTVVKTPSSASFVVGVPASYTLTVTNTGTAATTAPATITDNIPSLLTLGAPPAGCTASGQTVTCTVPAGLATGQVVSFVLPVTPQAAADNTTAANVATASGGGDPSCPAAAHCISTTNTPVGAPALTLVKSPSGTSFVVGVPASYTLTVTNTGTAATTAPATIADNIPGLLTVGAPPAGCSASGQTVTCTVPAGLATGQVLSFVIPVTPQASADGTTAANTATASGGGDPSCPAATRCTSTVDTPVEAPHLTLAKTASDASFVVGVPASYTLTVTNTGTAATTAPVLVNDNVPGLLSVGAPPAGCTASGQTVSCTIPAGLATGQVVSFVIPVTPLPAAAGTSAANTATASGGGDPSCPAAAPCTATVTTPVEAPQLTLIKTPSAASFVVGVPASYTLALTNTGTAATTATATITDNVPGLLSVGAPPAGCSASGQTVTCTVPAGLATGQAVTFVIPVTPLAGANGTTASNTATASGGGDPSCPAAAQCTSTVLTPIDAPQLTLVKTPSAASFVVGVPASYTLTVTNTGTAATTAGATVADAVPAALALGFLPTACTATGQSVTCIVAAGLAAGQTVSFVIPVTPLAGAGGNTVINTATASGGGDPSCPAAAHCTSSVGSPVGAPQLLLTKTASAPSFSLGVAASYTLTVTDTGSAPTTAAATIADNVPANLGLGAMPAGCTASGQLVTCTVPAGLAAGQSTSFSFAVTPLAGASGAVLVNTATISGGGDPTCPAAAHCAGGVNVSVDAPELTLAKTASVTSFTLGVPASYTLTVTNHGTLATPAPATVTDNVPAGLAVGALPAGCVAAAQTVTCSVAAGLGVGQAVSFVIPVTLQSSAGAPLSNTATLTGGGDETCPLAAHCNATVVVPAAAGIPTLSPWALAALALLLAGAGAVASRRQQAKGRA